MGGVSQDTWIAVAFTAMAVTFRGGLLGPMRQEVNQGDNRQANALKAMKEAKKKMHRNYDA